MPSGALQQFLAALEEVNHLGTASHPTLAPSALESLSLARAVGRGQIVLLSSHFERYFYAVNEELVTFLNTHQLNGSRLPVDVRLLHSAVPVDDLNRTGWEHRLDKLETFVAEDGWLWTRNASGTLLHERFLVWMKAPKPESLVRYYRYWGVNDIFTAVTRTKNTRSALWLSVRGLVELRNNIAHGDFAAQATQADIRRYAAQARQFCERADRALATQIGRAFAVPRPW
jgi:RiboL-PSP-HEPN